MSFEIKDYEFLKQSIDKLISSYSTVLGRYTINEKTKSGAVSEEPVDTLRLLIARVDENLTTCKSKRRTALDALTKLTNELREYIKAEDPDEKKSATLFLLGALIHRYFRIEKDRSSKAAKKVSSVVSYATLGLFGSASATKSTSKLYEAIGQVLNINKDRMIDSMTILRALEVFRDNMFLKIDVSEKDVIVKKERYKTYEHLRDDQNFRSNLDSMIYKYEILAAPTVKEFQAIAFMQSLMAHVDKQYGSNGIIDKELVRWCKEFSPPQKDWSKLDLEAMRTHITNKFKADDPIKKKILLFVENTDFSTVTDSETLLKMLRATHTAGARFTVAGGFILLSRYAGFKDTKVLEHITKEMALSTPLNKADMKFCVELFNDFLKDEANENLECRILEGRARLLTKIADLLKELNGLPPRPVYVEDAFYETPDLAM